VTVRLAEIVADRDLALLAPFALAGLLTAVLTAGIWKALIEGFGNERSP